MQPMPAGLSTLTSHLAASKVREYARCGPAGSARAPLNPCTPLGYSDKTISTYTFCFLELCFKLMGVKLEYRCPFTSRYMERPSLGCSVLSFRQGAPSRIGMRLTLKMRRAILKSRLEWEKNAPILRTPSSCLLLLGARTCPHAGLWAIHPQRWILTRACKRSKPLLPR